MTERPSTGTSRWVLLTAAVLALGAYIAQFYDHDFSTDPAEWGQFGDYMGGILNPIVAFGAFLWLVASVRIQKQELAETRKALQDSQRAQQDQADTTLIAARIETLNIELSSIVGQLQHYRNRQGQILELKNRPDNVQYFTDEKGTHQIVNVIREIHQKIVALEKVEANLLLEVRRISSLFKTTVPVDPNDRLNPPYSEFGSDPEHAM